MSMTLAVDQTCADLPGVMNWRRMFLGLPDQAGYVRGFVRLLLDEHSRTDDVLVVATELVTNALRHTASGQPGGMFSVGITSWHDVIVVSVRDQGGPNIPTFRPVQETFDTLSETGRGLFTVDAYSSRWIWSGGERGRTVSAFFWE
jgi:anti-sigma regulatory factor (Ser/Thr protein kinase)